MIVWRLTRAIYQDLSGAGGLKFRGRWNEVGRPIIYTSSSLALSVLERRVHSVQRPEDDVSIEIEIPDECVDLVGALPNGWKEDLELTRKIGSEWLRSNRSLCLRIPSAVIPDFNYLINPAHPDIGSIKIVAVTAFEYDPRLF